MKKLIILLLLFCSPTLAMYDNMHYQGYLYNNSDSSALSGTYDFTFRIYDDYTTGNLLYEQNASLTTDSNGVYIVDLTPPLAFDAQYYMEMDIEGETLEPRINLSTVPYAKRANISDHATEWDSYMGLTMIKGNITGYSEGYTAIPKANISSYSEGYTAIPEANISGSFFKGISILKANITDFEYFSGVTITKDNITGYSEGYSSIQKANITGYSEGYSSIPINNITGLKSSVECNGTDKLTNVTISANQLYGVCSSDEVGSGFTGITITKDNITDYSEGYTAIPKANITGYSEGYSAIPDANITAINGTKVFDWVENATTATNWAGFLGISGLEDANISDTLTASTWTGWIGITLVKANITGYSEGYTAIPQANVSGSFFDGITILKANITDFEYFSGVTIDKSNITGYSEGYTIPKSNITGYSEGYSGLLDANVTDALTINTTASIETDADIIISATQKICLNNLCTRYIQDNGTGVLIQG